jgi:hypothetical protein
MGNALLSMTAGFPLGSILLSSLYFSSAAWQTCGLAGATGFALCPGMVERLGNHSFIVGQLGAVQVFSVPGFVFLLLATRSEGSRKGLDRRKECEKRGERR